jgi:hypothetical protein
MFRSSKRHLDEAGESYFEHLAAACTISLTLAHASLACALHALIPGLCTRTASRSLHRLQEQFASRAAEARRRRADGVRGDS